MERLWNSSYKPWVWTGEVPVCWLIHVDDGEEERKHEDSEKEEEEVVASVAGDVANVAKVPRKKQRTMSDAEVLRRKAHVHATAAAPRLNDIHLQGGVRCRCRCRCRPAYHAIVASRLMPMAPP